MRADSDAGAATLELIALTLLLLVPVIYLVTALARVQSATYAAESGAYSAARAAVVAGLEAAARGSDDAVARTAARGAATASLAATAEDFGLDASGARLELDCGGPCLAPGSTVDAAVDIEVALPGVPAALADRLPLSVTVSAVASSPVDGYLP